MRKKHLSLEILREEPLAQELKEEEKAQVIEKLAEILSSSDFDIETLFGRVPTVEKEKLLEARKNLWKKRVMSLTKYYLWSNIMIKR